MFPPSIYGRNKGAFIPIVQYKSKASARALLVFLVLWYNYQMEHIKLLIKGIFIGIGGIAPGLSGSVIMISLGLYSRTIDAFATLNKDFKKKITFLVPIITGMLISTIFFSRIIEDSLIRFEIQTRLAFLGMLLGTVPLFFAEVKRKEKLILKHYLIMIPSFLVGLCFLFIGTASSSTESINVPIAFVLGYLGIALTIIPGLNWTTFFSAMGLYGHWLNIMSFRPENMSFEIYGPAVLGAVVGLFTISKAVSFLLNRAYTNTLSILFGFYIAVIPSIILDTSDELENLQFGPPLYIGIVLFIIGVSIALWFGKMSQPSRNANTIEGNK